MLYRFPVKELKAGSLSRRRGHPVVVMQYYPRFLSKELGAEYLRCLAPERALFQEFKSLEREIGDHDRAFVEVHYEERFMLSKQGIEALKRLSVQSLTEDIFLLCQCLVTQRCHADLLLLIARQCFKAPTQSLWHRYPVFESRVENGDESDVSSAPNGQQTLERPRG